MADERPTSPVHADVREQSVLDLVPFARLRRQVADRNGQARLLRQTPELGLPLARAVTVAPATISAYQKLIGVRVRDQAVASPPASNALYGEGGGLMILTHVDPADVALDVVDAIGDGLALLGDEVVDVHQLR